MASLFRHLALAATLAALSLALSAPNYSLVRAQDVVTIVVPDGKGAPVLYSQASAPESVLALDPETAPQAVSMLLQLLPEVSEIDAAAAAQPVAAAVASPSDDSSSPIMVTTTEEEAMVEATVSMLEAALADSDEMDAAAMQMASSSSSLESATTTTAESAAVEGSPAPLLLASAPSPIAVAPAAQLVCPPTCPAGTRCRQGGRGICEPFSAFDCAGGKCAPAPSTPPPTTTPTTTPAVCKSKCTDVAPTPNWSCAQQRSFGACEQGWMSEGNYCQITCGRCPIECYDCSTMCLDKAPDGNGCAAQAGWGKCGVSAKSFFFLLLFLLLLMILVSEKRRRKRE